MGNIIVHCPSGAKASQPLVTAARKPIVTLRKGTEGWNRVQSNLQEGRYSWNKPTSQPSQGSGNLIPASPHTALGETSVRAPWADVKRANSVGICLAK